MSGKRRKVRSYGTRGAAHRVILTTDDIAELLGISVEAVYKRIQRGSIEFTGNSIRDFWMLVELVSRDKIVAP